MNAHSTRHQFTIDHCDEAAELAWFTERPDRKYYVRPSYPAEIAHRCTIIPETARPLDHPDAYWATLVVIGLKRGGFNRRMTVLCWPITGEEDDETLRTKVFVKIVGEAIDREGWRP